MKTIRKLIATKGASLVEYGLLVGLLSALSIGVVLALGLTNQETFEQVSGSINENVFEEGAQSGSPELGTPPELDFSGFTVIDDGGVERVVLSSHLICSGCTTGSEYSSFSPYSEDLSIMYTGSEPVEYSIVSGSLPAGFTLDSATGIISGSYGPTTTPPSERYDVTVSFSVDGSSTLVNVRINTPAAA